jgi:hypothetical protein
MFLLLCVLCEMVGVTHNYYYYSILKRHERDKLKTLLLSLNYTTTIHTLCIEHMYMKLRFQHPPTMKTCMCTVNTLVGRECVNVHVYYVRTSKPPLGRKDCAYPYV